MLNASAMLHRARLVFTLVTLLAVAFASDVARAQTASSSGGTTMGSESVNSPLLNPNRALFQNGQYVDVTNNPRPQNLNPTGVNFADCEQDLKLTFPLVLSGFNGSSGLEVWAGTQDCAAADSARGIGMNPTCWLVSQQAGALLYTSATSVNIDVYARDVIRYENGNPPNPAFYDPTWHSSSAGASACKVQGSDAAISLGIYFVPVNVSGRTGTGTGYKFNFNADTVAPPPPTVGTIGFGDTLLTVNWTSPGDDPDIAGFAVWSDPPAGGTGGGGGCNCGSSPGGGSASSYVGDDGSSDALPTVNVDASQLVCIDSGGGASTVDGGDGGDGGDGAAAADAASDSAVDGAGAGATDGASPEASVSDAGADGGDAGDAGDGGLPPGCHYENVGGGSSCGSLALTGNTFVVGGVTVCPPDGGDSGCYTTTPTPVTTTADGASTGAEGGVTLSGGGISSIAPQYKAGEIDDRTATQMTLTGLTNGTNYVVVVTSIDGSGNVGPPSSAQCQVPVPVDDFWKTYKQQGGGANGCALESAGLPAQMPVLGIATALLVTLFRRRKRP